MFDRQEYLMSGAALKKELLSLFPRKSPITIFDIGGCEGEDSIKYSKLFPKSTIYVFEPLPANQELIRINLSVYAVNNIQLVPMAMSDIEGTHKFHVSSGRPKEQPGNLDWDFGNKSSSLLPPDKHTEIVPWITFHDIIEVPVNTIYSFCKQNHISSIDFVHMDVQGAELKALSGAGNFIEHIKCIYLEVADITLYQDQPLRKDIEEFMDKKNFQLIKTSMDGPAGDQLYINKKYFTGFEIRILNLQFYFRRRNV